jgi:hypothetical protein
VTEPFAVQKKAVRARLTLVGEAAQDVDLYVSEAAAGHAGMERPSDLLEIAQRFFPVRHADGGISFVNHDAVLILSVPSDAELGADELPVEDLAAPQATTLPLEVHLEGGAVFTGTVVYLMPEAQSRVQDYLNDSQSPFLPLRDGDTVHLLNKGRIVRVMVR